MASIVEIWLLIKRIAGCDNFNIQEGSKHKLRKNITLSLSEKMSKCLKRKGPGKFGMLEDEQCGFRPHVGGSTLNSAVSVHTLEDEH